MNRRAKYISFLLLVAGLASSCIEPYEPIATVNAPDILVIEGFVNTSDLTATVRVTHAVPLKNDSAESVPPPERGAVVTIEDFEGNLFALTESNQDGTYTADGLPLATNQKYRLNVLTYRGKKYQSEFVEFLNAPPIDSITWRGAGDNLEILVNTHDNSGKTKFYQWKFVETWKFSAPYMSNFTLAGGIATYRPFSEQNYLCYRSQPSTTINIGSTSNLTSGIVRDHVVATIPAHSAKIAYRYSILVQQTALTEEAYGYWKLLERTTQNLGGLFDPLPARVTGNITCVTNDEPVLGYFSGGSFTEKRLFISGNEVPGEYRFIPRAPYGCQVDSVLFADLPPNGYIISTFGTPFPIGYTMSSLECTDCRAVGKGATTAVPDFWIE